MPFNVLVLNLNRNMRREFVKTFAHLRALLNRDTAHGLGLKKLWDKWFLAKETFVNVYAGDSLQITQIKKMRNLQPDKFLDAL